MTTFAVSPVERSHVALPRIDLFTSFAGRLKSSVEACGANAETIVSIPGGSAAEFEESLRREAAAKGWTNPVTLEQTRISRWNVPHPGFVALNGFLAALGLAFDGHYPLVLSPDDVWLCIAQGFALHVSQHAEALRSRFVRHEGQLPLRITRSDFIKGAAENPWPEVLAGFSDQIAAHLGKKRDLVVADFSTTGAVERAATEIVLLDAMQSYFHYRVRGLCGIPQITLSGTADDWRKIRARSRCLAEYDLDEWLRELLPVLDELVATAEGAPKIDFWRSIYLKCDMSGGPRAISGWCNVFFPYLRYRGGIRRNDCLDLWHRVPEDPEDDLTADGPWLEQFPSGLSIAPFVLEIDAAEIAMEMLGGFAGVTQHEDGSVQPVIGWAVREIA